MNIFNGKGSIKGLLKTAAVISLAVAWIIGFSHRDDDILSVLNTSFPEGTQIEKLSTVPLLLRADTEETKEPLYISVDKAQGYGGPVVFAIVTDGSGTIKRTIVVKHRETFAWYRKLTRARFFEQFTGKRITDPFIAGSDIDTVSRATISSVAFTSAASKASYSIGKKVLKLDVSRPVKTWKFGLKETALLLLYAVIIIGVSRKMRQLRYVTLAAGLVFLGFYASAPLSLANISALMLGYVPSFMDNTFWWLLVAGTLLMTFLYGRNLYCLWLCPFGAIQEFTSKISDINIKLNRTFLKRIRYLPHVLVWAALMMIFLSSNPCIASYEPFTTLFGLEGIGVQWYLLPLVIIGSFLIKRFWCRFFCPVGILLQYTCRARHSLDKLIEGKGNG